MGPLLQTPQQGDQGRCSGPGSWQGQPGASPALGVPGLVGDPTVEPSGSRRRREALGAPPPPPQGQPSFGGCVCRAESCGTSWGRRAASVSWAPRPRLGTARGVCVRLGPCGLLHNVAVRPHTARARPGRLWETPPSRGDRQGCSRLPLPCYRGGSSTTAWRDHVPPVSPSRGDARTGEGSAVPRCCRFRTRC